MRCILYWFAKAGARFLRNVSRSVRFDLFSQLRLTVSVSNKLGFIEGWIVIFKIR